MRRANLILGIILLSLSIAKAEERPNIILIFCDDMGYNDLGCFASKKIKTPHLDQLASEGRRFTNFMVPCSVCSPSRAALLTGCYPKRVEMHEHVLFPKSKKGLHPDEVTIADHLKSAGYATGCVGKWHLGHYPETLPLSQGFESYYGIPYSNDMNHPDNKRPQGATARDESWKNQASTLLWRTPLVINNDIAELPTDQRTITRRYTDKAIEFVSARAQGDKPFFLYLPHSMPHIPLFVPDDAYDPDPANAYTCTIEHIDAEIGRLMQTVRELGIAKKTIVIFTSDNGPWLQFKNHGGSALPLRMGKGTPFEGGQRVPCIVWAPGRVPANTESDAFLSTMDVLPTIAKWVGTPLGDKKIDGLDASETITGDAASPRTEMVYYTANGRLTGMRRGDWKYLVNPLQRKVLSKEKEKSVKKEYMLFNLADDISESNNLYDSHPDQVVMLKQLMSERDKEITKNQRKAWRTENEHPWPVYPNGFPAKPAKLKAAG
jgi:arylsulfatase A